MNKNLIKFFIYMLVLTLPFALLAKGGDGKNQLRKTQGSPIYTRFNINNVSTYIYNDGRSDIQPNGNSGFIFPKFSNKAPFYQSGFLWGGKIDGQIRVGGSVYRSGLRPGRILTPGTRASESDPDVRVYRVRRDVPGYAEAAKMINKVKPEARDEGITAAEVVTQYQLDWNEWPATQGAPYEDIDKNGSYDPTKDIPGFVGADQTVWFVNNDLDEHTTDFMYGTLPMGIEQQVTMWGYNKAGDLGNMMFRKYIIINKNAQKKSFTDMYVSMWSDPDNGDAGDDYVGCDTTLSLQYIYNAKASDATYGTNPPAAGFDFFQGPRIKTNAPTDTAIFKGKKWSGYKNLPMTAAYYFAQGGTPDYQDPQQGISAGAQQFYNLFQGFVSRSGVPFPIPTQYQVPGGPKSTQYPLSGDPVAVTGYLDGAINPPGDRRMGSASGTFTLAYGDTQEVVVAQIAAGARTGISNIRAITLLKAADKEAQKAFNNFFPKPTPFLNPVVEVVNLDREIVLNWGADLASVAITEGYKDEFYQFQGYELFQLATEGSSIEDANTVRIGTFDLIDGKTSIIGPDIDPVSGDVISKVYHYGKDTDLNRSFYIKRNYITNENLNNGSRYFFAVRAYATTDSSFIDQKSITTTLDVLTAIPQTPDPGVRFQATVDQVINATHSKGVSGGKVQAVVVDPTKVNGHTYEVSFATTGWSVKDNTANKVLVKDQTNQAGNDASPIVDGLKVKVFGAADEITKFLVTANGKGKLTPAQMGTFAFNSNGFPTHEGSDRPSAGQQSTNASLWGIATGNNGSSTIALFSSFLSRSARNDNFTRIVPFDWEIRFTAKGSKAQLAFTNGKIVDVPFELWNTGIGTPNDTKDDYQVIPLVYDFNGNDVFDLDKQDHPVSGGDNDPETDWIYIYDVTDHTPGTKGYDAAVASNFDEAATSHTIGDEVLARLVLVNFNGGSVAAANWPANVNSQMPETGTIFRIETSKPNYPGADVFTFTAPSVTTDASLAKEDVDKVNVFPNPYYGVNSQEINKYQRFVTFNHLPKMATIRIFNLAGQLVRTIDKNTDTQYQRWDLKNFDNLPVASGMYVVQVDMPAEGVKKVLKLIVIQETQVLDKF